MSLMDNQRRKLLKRLRDAQELWPAIVEETANHLEGTEEVHHNDVFQLQKIAKDLIDLTCDLHAYQGMKKAGANE